MVLELLNVFPTDLVGMPMNRNIGFCTDLEPVSHPTFIPHYRMTMEELRELKTQLYKLLYYGFFILMILLRVLICLL